MNEDPHCQLERVAGIVSRNLLPFRHPLTAYCQGSSLHHRELYIRLHRGYYFQIFVLSVPCCVRYLFIRCDLLSRLGNDSLDLGRIAEIVAWTLVFFGCERVKYVQQGGPVALQVGR